MLCLENLHVFLDFVAYCYAEEYVETKFDPALVPTGERIATAPAEPRNDEVDLAALIEENKRLKEQLTARREAQQQTYVPKPLDISEYETRKIYIDTMLEDAGWVEGKNWRNEVELPGAPNRSEVGVADYVLYDDAQKPLAIIEAKRTCMDVSKGRQQAEGYADILEKRFGRRPVVFLTNGFETHILDGLYPERECATVYSKRDLEKMFHLRTMRTSLKHVVVKKHIAGRYYQKGAVKAVCDAFDRKNSRKALLVMAMGAGKTRTVIALCDVLLQHRWVKNILFLADRNALVSQAKKSFTEQLPDISTTNLCEDKDNYTAHCVFSTYQTMMHCIDTVEDDQGKRFTCGYFDLVICDEAHRSIYHKYRDIFNYFDAPLVGLTATPKNEIDKNTYEFFQLQNGVPTYSYALSRAVKDGYLVDFMSVETKLKFVEQGVVYDELTEAEKDEYEEKFLNENGELPEKIVSSALNAWVFHVDTIRQVLHVLMTEGIKMDYGQKLGKTIIFAQNHSHAEKIREVFDQEYPHLPGFAKVIDNRIHCAQTLIDRFSDPRMLPQIAISVDMLDTGIDVPACVNLVFFKKVMSKAKFWQMIGRGTRLCPGLQDGKDKDKFYVFDFCGNFAFFRMRPEGHTMPNQLALPGVIFSLKAMIVFKLQDLAYQTPELTQFRQKLIEDMVGKVQALNKGNFAVRQHLKYVELFSNPDHYGALTYENIRQMREELAPLIHPEEDEVRAVRFDALMYGIEAAYLMGKKYSRGRSELLERVSSLADIAHIPQISEQRELIHKILDTSYLENAGISEFESIRQKLRVLMKYISHPVDLVDAVVLVDEIQGMEWK